MGNQLLSTNLSLTLMLCTHCSWFALTFSSQNQEPQWNLSTALATYIQVRKNMVCIAEHIYIVGQLQAISAKLEEL